MAFFKKLKLIICSFFSAQLLGMASSLSFYTLLSLVPALALCFGLAKGFNLEGFLEEHIHEVLSQQKEVATYLINFSHKLLESTSEEWIAGLGVFFLLLSGLSLFSHVEFAFNRIFKFSTKRSFKQKLIDYPALFFFAPFIFIFSITFHHFLSDHVKLIPEWAFLPHQLWLFFPYGIMTLLFFFIYRFFPCGYVALFPAFAGGLFATAASVFFEWFFVTFLLKLLNYGVVYGSFAFFPLFLLWLYSLWIVLLQGCQLCYSLQNFSILLYKDPEAYSPLTQAAVLWKVLRFLSQEKEKGPCSLVQIQRSIGLSSLLVKKAIVLLQHKQWVEQKGLKYEFIKESLPSLSETLQLFFSYGESFEKDIVEERTSLENLLKRL